MTIIVLCSFLAGIAACLAFVSFKAAVEPIRKLVDIYRCRRSIINQLKKVT